MGGDGGEMNQARVLLAMRNDPDYEYRNLTRTQIEDRVKRQSAHLTSKTHSVTLNDGRKLKFIINNKNIEHFVSDAGGRAKGVLNISDIKNLDKTFPNAKHVSSSEDIKKKGSGVTFHYFRAKIGKKVIYLNIKEDKKKQQNELYSITKKIK